MYSEMLDPTAVLITSKKHARSDAVVLPVLLQIKREPLFVIKLRSPSDDTPRLSDGGGPDLPNSTTFTNTVSANLFSILAAHRCQSPENHTHVAACGRLDASSVAHVASHTGSISCRPATRFLIRSFTEVGQGGFSARRRRGCPRLLGRTLCWKRRTRFENR
jgi:hypothetical protein